MSCKPAGAQTVRACSTGGPQDRGAVFVQPGDLVVAVYDAADVVFHPSHLDESFAGPVVNVVALPPAPDDEPFRRRVRITVADGRSEVFHSGRWLVLFRAGSWTAPESDVFVSGWATVEVPTQLPLFPLPGNA